jgi:hypothetical protein
MYRRQTAPYHYPAFSKAANLFLRSILSALKYQYDTGNYIIQIFLTNRIYEYFLSVRICHSLESKLEKAEDASYRDPIKTAPQKQLVMNLISMYFILNSISNRQVPSILFMALAIIRWRPPLALSSIKFTVPRPISRPVALPVLRNLISIFAIQTIWSYFPPGANLVRYSEHSQQS